MAHTIVKARKISSVSANIEYLQNTKKHPELCHSYSTCSMELWQEYALVNQEAFAGSGQSGRCVEAHELIFVCPEEFYRLSDRARISMVEGLANRFKEKHGVEVYIALHGSDSDSSNMHMHLMYMERKLQPELEKIAKRNMYFDAEGKQVRAKKDALDQEGNLLPGYRFVKKGDCYGRKTWTAKEKYLRGKKFTEDTKEWWTKLINLQKKHELLSDMEEREVYDRKTSPYLVLQDVRQPLQYRNEEAQVRADEEYQAYVQDMLQCNQLRKEYNDAVKSALQSGVEREELVDRRKRLSEKIYKRALNKPSGVQKLLKAAIRLIEHIKRRLEPLKSILGHSDASEGINNTKEPLKGKLSLQEQLEDARADTHTRHTVDIGTMFGAGRDKNLGR